MGLRIFLCILQFFAARVASGSADFAISPAWMMFAAPAAPITAISAFGQANTKSAPIALEFSATYAPPYALRKITVIFGTVASE